MRSLLLARTQDSLGWRGELPFLLSSRHDKVQGNRQAFRVDGQMTTIATTSCQKACSMTSEFLLPLFQKPDTAFQVSCWPEKLLHLKSHPLGKSCRCAGFIRPTTRGPRPTASVCSKTGWQECCKWKPVLSILSGSWNRHPCTKA